MKTKKIVEEFKHHIPFTFLATFLAFALVGSLIWYYGNGIVPQIKSLFFIFHPAHILASSIVSSALFYKYKKRFFLAILVGVFGAIIIGSLSDIILPYLGGEIFGFGTSFHLEVLESPLLIFGFSLVGSLLGIRFGISRLPHFLHVFLSIFASLFYLIGFSSFGGVLDFLVAGVIVFFSVLIPCCLSDIVFPVWVSS